VSKKAHLHSGLLEKSAVAGYENLVVWADLLDAINVFPVADGDTGTNLKVSLTPLRYPVHTLHVRGIGNSGNIAAAFLTEFLDPDGANLGTQAFRGKRNAYKAVHKPSVGTMLDLFDALVQILQDERWRECSFAALRHTLQKSVAETADRLPALAEAGVVDSGALGMFVFFDGFFQHYMNGKVCATPVMELFPGRLKILSSFQPQKTGEYCVEAVLASDKPARELSREISRLGQSAVLVPAKSKTKVHLHTKDPDALRKGLSSLGQVVSWSDEAIDPLLHSQNGKSFSANRIRVMCDAAGSIPLSIARQSGIILLDSYIVTPDQAMPESLYNPEKLYLLMRSGVKVSTAQASNNERDLHFHAACAQYGEVLYICAGSAFTKNFEAAKRWKEASGSADTFVPFDSGAASGRLAVIAILTARLAKTGAAADTVIDFAKRLGKEAEEFVFIDELKYLVAGGRVTKTKAFFADLLHMKPVISPRAEGVRKMGVVRNKKAQLDFALEKLRDRKFKQKNLFVLLQYSDNKLWLEQQVRPVIRTLLPHAEIVLVPLSLTSGVHMGPGTWSLAHGEK
jgi:DegV family protein with EDD domain